MKNISLLVIAILMTGCGVLNITSRDYVAPQTIETANIRFISNLTAEVSGHECGSDDRVVKLARLYEGPISVLNLNKDKSLNMPLPTNADGIMKTELMIPANQPYGISIGGQIVAKWAPMPIEKGKGTVARMSRYGCAWQMFFTPEPNKDYEVHLYLEEDESKKLLCYKNLIEIKPDSEDKNKYVRTQHIPDGEFEGFENWRNAICNSKK
jgi:hypothetical protein